MKKILFLLTAAVCILLSCRSVNNESTIAHQHISRDADSMVAIIQSEGYKDMGSKSNDIDSLYEALQDIRKKYRELYVRDSINESGYRSDSVHVKDSSWVKVNEDGSLTHYSLREKNTYSYQRFERYMQQVIKDNIATIDSLINVNEHLRSQYDSIYHESLKKDSIWRQESRQDSIYDSVSEQKEKTVHKNGLWDKGKVFVGTIMLLFVAYFAIRLYRAFKRR